jgi:hypothetical protein
VGKINLTRWRDKKVKSRKESKTFKSNKMAGITIYISILTLKINGLNSPIKNRMERCIKNQGLIICCTQETNLTDKNTGLGWRDWKYSSKKVTHKGYNRYIHIW